MGGIILANLYKKTDWVFDSLSTDAVSQATLAVGTTTHARLGRIIAVTVLFEKVPKPGKRIPKALIRDLRYFNLALTVAKSDVYLGELAKNRLEVLEALETYFKTKSLEDYHEVLRLRDVGGHIADSISGVGGFGV